MHGSQRNITIGLAFFLALIVVLVGRVLRGTEASPTSSSADQRIAFVVYNSDNTGYIAYATLFDTDVDIEQQRTMKFQRGVIPVVRMAENGAYVANGLYNNPLPVINWLIPGTSVLELPSSCRFPDISPDGQSVVCVQNGQPMIVRRNDDRIMPLTDTTSGMLGAPTVYNTLVSVSQAQADTTLNMALSLQDGSAAHTLEGDGIGLYTNDGTMIVSAIQAVAGAITSVQTIRLSDDTTKYATVPNDLRGTDMRLIAVSDDGNQVLLYTERMENGVQIGRMGLLNVSDGAYVVFWPEAAAGVPQGDFSADGQYVTFSLGNTIYHAGTSQPDTWYVANGTQPIWLADTTN